MKTCSGMYAPNEEVQILTIELPNEHVYEFIIGNNVPSGMLNLIRHIVKDIKHIENVNDISVTIV